MLRAVVALLLLSPLLARGQEPAPGRILLDRDARGEGPRLCYPGGRLKAVTLSFDDGSVHDHKLVEALNRHGLRATFHLVSSLLDRDGYVKKSDVAALHKGHEVASHTLTHANLPKCSDAEIERQILEDRKTLESLAGYPVQGLAYPGGEYDARVAALMPRYGLRYTRVVGTHHGFGLPKKPFEWAGTCSLGQMLKDGKRFLDDDRWPALLFVWGHSYEFEEQRGWGLIEEFGTLIGGRPELWYATNIEIVDYLDPARRVEISGDGSLCRNPGAVAVWVVSGGKTWELKPGATTRIG